MTGTHTEMVAILRGLTPQRALETGQALREAGFRTIEVPLNSPQPLDSIKLLAAAYPDCLVGAGTVLTAVDVNNVRAAGGKLIVSPNCDPQVIRHALGFGMRVMPVSLPPPKRSRRSTPVRRNSNSFRRPLMDRAICAHSNRSCRPT